MRVTRFRRAAAIGERDRDHVNRWRRAPDLGSVLCEPFRVGILGRVAQGRPTPLGFGLPWAGLCYPVGVSEPRRVEVWEGPGRDAAVRPECVLRTTCPPMGLPREPRA